MLPGSNGVACCRAYAELNHHTLATLQELSFAEPLNEPNKES
jgi:hypothetical protein